MSTYRAVICGALFTLGTLAAQPASAAVTTFQDGTTNDFTGVYSGTSDAEINNRSGNADKNYGTEGHLWAGVYEAYGFEFENTYRSLIRFDLSSMVGYQVTGATLKLTISVGGLVNGLNTFNLYAVNSSETWVEGAGNGAAAAAGEPSWNSRSSPTAWAGGTGLGAPGGGSYSSTLLGTFTYAEEPTNSVINITLDPSIVDSWISGGNAGLLIRNASEPTLNTESHVILFYSSETATAANRPALEVTYIPEPASIVLLGLGGLAMLRRRHA